MIVSKNFLTQDTKVMAKSKSKRNLKKQLLNDPIQTNVEEKQVETKEKVEEIPKELPQLEEYIQMEDIIMRCDNFEEEEDMTEL